VLPVASKLRPGPVKTSRPSVPKVDVRRSNTLPTLAKASQPAPSGRRASRLNSVKPGTRPWASALFSSPRAHVPDCEATVMPTTAPLRNVHAAFTLSVWRAMPGRRSPGRTAMSVQASQLIGAAVELFGLFNTSGVRNVASTRL
jgi:hypothetical protein